VAVTVFGVIVAVLALYLLATRPLLDMLILVLVCSLLAGSAAVILTKLGNVSVQPVSFALAFLIVRYALSHRALAARMAVELRENVLLAMFCLYGAITAFLLPRIFAGQINVVTMRPMPANSMFDTTPLAFSTQNITASAYLIGTMMASVIGAAAAANPRSGDAIAKGGVAISAIHVFFGVLGVVLSSAGAGWVLDVFRNATYAQVSQDIQGFVRINGIFPEPSSYCAYAFVWLVFMTELWQRNVRPSLTGPAAIALALVLMASTSSTAYVSLGLYGAVLALRWSAFPRGLGLGKGIWLGALALVTLAALLGLIITAPKFAATFGDIIQSMTTGKMSSSSGRERTFWALQGLQAFSASLGLGIGAGSFRSSSLITAILGSMGVVGAVSFTLHLWLVLKPWRRSTYVQPRDDREALGVAAAWTAVLGLIPAAIGSPSPDPGILFGIFSGLALGWRHRPWAVRRPAIPHALSLHEIARASTASS
jgi:hypothetical protein